MRSTLILGLGGTGGLITKMVKKLFVEEYGKKPPPHIIFTHIDTKAGGESEEHALTGLPEIEEIICTVDEIQFKVVQTDEYLNKNPEMKEWLAIPLPVEDIIGGAWQIRQCGRIAFFEHRRINERIQKKLEERVYYLTGDEVSKRARTTKGIELEPRALDVFLINSLAGGTGSGMFLDIAGVIKNLKPEATITLITLLPRLFEKNIDAVQSIHLLYANTYASLKEINFYMSNPWEVTYDYDPKAREIVRVPKSGSQGKLFDFIHLVDNVNRAGKNLIDRLHTAPLVTEFIYNSVTAAGERIIDERKTMQRHITPEQWCSSFGVSILNFPLEEVLSICENLFLQKVVEKALLGEYKSSDIREELNDPDTGLTTNNNNFDYKSWMNQLCRRKGYTPQKARSVMAGSKSKVYSKLIDVKKKLEEELISDKRAISANLDKVADKIRGDLRKVVKKALFQKGVDYARNLLIQLKTKLDIEGLKARKVQLTDEKREEGEIPNLDKLISSALKDIKGITERRLSWGWYRKCEPNVDRVIRNLKDKTEKELEVEKLSYAIKLVEKIVEDKVGMIASELEQINNLDQKLNTLIAKFNSGQEKGYDNLGFIASNETKLIQTEEQVLAFYNKYFLGMEEVAINTIKTNLTDWMKKTIDNIEKICKKYVQARVADKEIEKLTIKDVGLPQTELNKKMEDSLRDTKPFWQITASKKLQRTDFVLTGFTTNELKDYSSFRDTKGFIRTVNDGDSEEVAAKKKRRMVFLSLEYGVPITDLSAYGLKDYAKEYKELNPRENPWVHLNRAAVGFEELIGGFSTGMEEEALLQTCRDLGIVFQRGAWYSYQELVKEEGKETLREKRVAQGYQNTIEAMEKDPTLCKELVKKVHDKLDQMPKSDRHSYVRSHDPATYSEQAEFSKEHQLQYKDNGSKKPIPSHTIPNYILEKINIKDKR